MDTTDVHADERFFNEAETLLVVSIPMAGTVVDRHSAFRLSTAYAREMRG